MKEDIKKLHFKKNKTMENIEENEIEHLISQEIVKLKKTITYLEEAKDSNELYKKKVEEMYFSTISLKAEVSEHFKATNKNIDTKIDVSTSSFKKEITSKIHSFESKINLAINTLNEKDKILENNNNKLNILVYVSLIVSIFLLIKSC
jgi:hypothetical protein